MPIFDQGYQHWSGRLTGGTWRWLAITRHGVRAGMKNRLLRLLLIVSWIPALVLVVMLCLWGLLERRSAAILPMMQFFSFLHPQILADPRHFRVEIWTICYDFFLLTELRFSMVLVLLVGPTLISQDLRFNALPLYFSRPLRRIDYFLGKLGIVVVFLGRMIILPCLIAYVLGLLFSLDWTIVRQTLRLLCSGVVYGLVISVSAGTLILALSSLSRNSRYVALFWLGIWFVGSVVGGVLQAADREQRRHATYSATMIPAFDPSATPAQQMRQQWEWERALQKARHDFELQEALAMEHDWRPLASYTMNLSRIGERLLGTNAAWTSLSRLLPADERSQFLLTFTGPRYPWQWSAGVLLGLFGLSACILNLRVKSLDRLR
jgi:ABC-2 type transport system permease protein